MHTRKNQAIVVSLFVFFGLPVLCLASPSVSFVAGTSAGWDFHQVEGDIARNNTVDLGDLSIIAAHWLANGCGSANQWCAGADLDDSTGVDLIDYSILANNFGKQAGQNVLLQTIYGTAQDSAGNIVPPNTTRALQSTKGMAMAFAVPQATALDKGIFKMTALSAGKTVEVRLYDVTGKGYLTYNHGSVSRADPGTGGTKLMDVTANIPSPVLSHSEGTQVVSDMVIDFGSLEVTAGEYLLVFDTVATNLTTSSFMVKGLAGTVAAGMGTYPDGTPLPKRAAVTTSVATGNTYYYYLNNGTDVNYSHAGDQFACQITTVVINHPPVVNAGPDQTVTFPDAANLSGTATDDGIPNPPGALTTTWSRTSGPGTVTFGNTTALNTTATFSALGTYVLRLTANDGELTAYDEITINYTSGNQAPVVDAGTNTTIINPVNSINLDGTVTDDGKPNPPGVVTTIWTKQSGPGTVTFGDASAVDTTATFSAYGVYVLRLTANDSDLSSYDEVTITYQETPTSNQAPVVNAGIDMQIALTGTALLDGTVTDDGLPNPPGVVRTTWTMTSGPGTVTFGNASLADTTATFPVAGTYVLRLTANDNELSSYDEMTISVNTPPAPAAFLQWDGGLNHHMVGNEISYGRWEDASNWYCDAIPGRSRTLPTLNDVVKLHFFVTNDPPNPNNPVFNPQSHITIDTVGVAKAAKLQAKEYVNSLTVQPGADLEVAGNIEWYQDMNFNVHDLYIYGTVNACHEKPSQVRIGGEQSGATDTVYVYGVLNAFGKNGGSSIWMSRSTIANGTMDHNRLYIYSTGIVTSDDLLMCPTCDCLIDITSGGKLIIRADEKARIDGYVAASLFAGDGVLGNVTVTYFADSGETVIQPAGVPQVCAGSDVQIINPVNSVSLNGTVIPDGITTQWTQKSGPSTVVFGDASQVDTTATFSAYGTYVLHLEAAQGGVTGYDDVTVTYLATQPPPNQPPVANAGPDQQTTLGGNVTLNGTATDDGLPNPPGAVTAAWTMQSGPGTVTFSNANAAATTASFSAAGAYVLRLTASDSVLTSYDDVTINVAGGGSGNQPPVANAGSDLIVQAPATVATLSGTATDDGLPNPPGHLTVTWTQQSGPGTVTFADPHSAVTTATASAFGTYLLRLTADDGALQTYDEVTVTWYVYEGYAPVATGGTGGTVVHVTSLNESGAGSLGAVIGALSGAPTIVVFDVGGCINLTGEITISRDNVTIDGASAPNPGITLVDNGTAHSLGIKANNVIVRNIRARHVDADNANGSIIIWSGSGIIIDHCSLTGAGDSALATTESSVDHVVISRCLFGGDVESFRSHGTYMCAHHNLLTWGNRRNPRIYSAGPYWDFRNNIVDYWTGTGTNILSAVAVNIINNYYGPPGPTSSWQYACLLTGTTDPNTIYTHGNYCEGFNVDGLGAKPTPNLEPNVTTTDAVTAYSSIMSNVGAQPPDAIDQYYINGGGLNPPAVDCSGGGSSSGGGGGGIAWSETANYYVDGTTGSDSNPGTSDLPWQTLVKAVGTATSGQKVLVWGGQIYNGALAFSNSGTSSSPITFKRDPSTGPAVIDGGASTSGTLSTTGAKFIVIDGFTIQNGKYGIYAYGSGVTDWTIKNCRVTDNSMYGIYVRSGINFSFFNDAVYLNAATTTGIYFFNSATNNNVAQCNVYSQKYGITYDTSASGTVTNSIVANNTIYGVYNKNSTVTITYSDVWSNGTNYSGCSAGTGCIIADPKWTAPDDGDFHLGSGSPAHNTASDAGDMGYRYSTSAL